MFGFLNMSLNCEFIVTEPDCSTISHTQRQSQGIIPTIRSTFKGTNTYTIPQAFRNQVPMIPNIIFRFHPIADQKSISKLPRISINIDTIQVKSNF